MRKLAIVMVLLAACQKKDEPKPAPAPTEAPKPTESAKSEPPKPTETKPAGPCVVDVKVTDKVAFDGGGVKGETTLDALDFAALKPLAGKCAANIAADDTASYQKLIAIMDKLVANGITDVGLGSPSSARTVPPTGPKIDMEWKDGKLTGTLDPKVPIARLPIIVISTTSVTVGATATQPGKVIGKPDDADLRSEITAALPTPPKDPTIIIQADQRLSYAPIHAVVEGAKKAGYDNVLFAVKNR